MTRKKRKDLTKVNTNDNLKSRSLIFFETGTGRRPAFDFIQSLPRKVQNKTFETFKVIEKMTIVPSNMLKKLVSTDLYEIRISCNKKEYRYFCFYFRGKWVVLTHGIVKKSQKTPQKEIQKAEAMRRDFLQRFKE